MLCDECGSRPATIHLTKVLGGVKTERHLCAECAKEKGELETVMNGHASIANMLAGMLKTSAMPAREKQGVVCEQCGRSYEDFAKAGRLGCSCCYTKFEARLEPVLRRIHGSTEHTGKAPKRKAGGISVRRQIEERRKRLEDAIKREAYEEAAVLRDEIRELEKPNGQG